MEGLTDDTKGHVSPRVEDGPSDAHVAWRIPAQRLFTAARAAMSPATTLALLHSRLPAAVSCAIAGEWRIPVQRLSPATVNFGNYFTTKKHAFQT